MSESDWRSLDDDEEDPSEEKDKKQEDKAQFAKSVARKAKQARARLAKWIAVRKELQAVLQPDITELVVVYLESAEFSIAIECYWKSEFYVEDYLTEAYNQFKAAVVQAAPERDGAAEFYVAQCELHGYGIRKGSKAPAYQSAYHQLLIEVKRNPAATEEMFCLGLFHKHMWGPTHPTDDIKIPGDHKVEDYRKLWDHHPSWYSTYVGGRNRVERTEFALEWFGRAARLGHARSALELAQLYEAEYRTANDIHIGDPIDNALALYWVYAAETLELDVSIFLRELKVYIDRKSRQPNTIYAMYKILADIPIVRAPGKAEATKLLKFVSVKEDYDDGCKFRCAVCHKGYKKESALKRHQHEVEARKSYRYYY